jgi:hypothetical protein
MAVKDDVALRKARLLERRARLPDDRRASFEARLRGKSATQGGAIPL